MELKNPSSSLHIFELTRYVFISHVASAGITAIRAKSQNNDSKKLEIPNVSILQSGIAHSLGVGYHTHNIYCSFNGSK